jgi:Flp pilus assembly protein TadG
MRKLFPRRGNLVSRFLRDRDANAAVEFAFIVPLMLVLFFGTVEFSSGVAAQRKVVLATRNLSDLVSQSSAVTDTDLDNYNSTSRAIMNPFPLSPDYSARVTELYIDPTTKIGQVKWSKGWGASKPALTGTMAVPTALQVGGTYVIYGEVSYKYVPAVGYVMAPAGVSMSEVTYTRPRQSTCVTYGSVQNC